jgi:predicted MFS family arabinose efflux permease
VLLLMLSRKLGGGDSGYGYLLAGFGVGGLIGAAVAARLRIRDPRLLVAATLFVTAVPSALLAVVPSVPVGVALAVAIGAGAVAVEVVVDTSLGRRLDETVLARAYGLAFPASIAGIAVGSLITAPLVGWLGLTATLVVVGALVGAYALWIVLPELSRWPVRRVRLDALAPTAAE